MFPGLIAEMLAGSSIGGLSFASILNLIAYITDRVGSR